MTYNKRRFGMIIIFLIIWARASSYAQNGDIRQLSLDEALAMARKNSYQILIAQSQVEHARGQNLESMSGFLPRLSISENYIKSNDPVTVFSLKLKQGIFTQEDFNLSTLNEPDALDNFTTSFQIQQPVLNFDAIYGKAAASLGVKARKEAANRARETVSLQVKKAYYGLILARENLKAIDDAVQSAQSHRDDARAAYDEGLINQADYLAAEVRLADLQEQRITASHQVANASDGLWFVMGVQDETLIVPTDSLSLPQGYEQEVSLDNLTANRSDLRAIHFQTKAASRNLWMNRSNWMPRLNAFGAVEWNASEAFSKDASNWAVGLQLQWQFFQGLGTAGRSKQAAAQKQEAEVQYRRAEEQARMEVRKAQRGLKAAEERVQVAQSAVAQAQESLRIVEARFGQGLEKTSNLLDKEVALTNAKLRFLRAKHDFHVAKSELDYALGVE